MKDKLIEHLSSEIQWTAETTMTFRTRIAFIAWIGPFILLGSVVVSTRGFFRIPVDDVTFLSALIVLCICYLNLGCIGALMERLAWKRCDDLRCKIIQYTKQTSLDNISDSDLNHPRMARNVIRVYMWAFIVILISFLSISIAISRIEGKVPSDDRKTVAVPSNTEPNKALRGDALKAAPQGKADVPVNSETPSGN